MTRPAGPSSFDGSPQEALSQALFEVRAAGGLVTCFVIVVGMARDDSEGVVVVSSTPATMALGALHAGANRLAASFG